METPSQRRKRAEPGFALRFVWVQLDVLSSWIPFYNAFPLLLSLQLSSPLPVISHQNSFLRIIMYCDGTFITTATVYWRNIYSLSNFNKFPFVITRDYQFLNWKGRARAKFPSGLWQWLWAPLRNPCLIHWWAFSTFTQCPELRKNLMLMEMKWMKSGIFPLLWMYGLMKLSGGKCSAWPSRHVWNPSTNSMNPQY